MKEQSEKLDAKTLSGLIKPSNINYLSRLTLLDVIDSSNSFLLEELRLLSPLALERSGWAVFAEQQTAGRGRQGKEWYSPYGANIYCSLSWCFEGDFIGLSALGMACGAMLVQCLQDLGVKEGLGLKWPNDLYYSGRKLAGILLETQVSKQRQQVVIGVGLNYCLPEEKREAWVSVDEILEGKHSRKVVAAGLLNALLEGVVLFEKEGLRPFLGLCREHDLLLGKEVELVTSQENIVGRASGINEKGELILATEKGERAFCYGEVSVRLKV